MPPVAHAGDLPAGIGRVDIQDIGEFSFDAGQVNRLRPDILQPGHFSLFDVVAHLGERGDVALKTHFDEEMDTHVIDGINGLFAGLVRAECLPHGYVPLQERFPDGDTLPPARPGWPSTSGLVWRWGSRCSSTWRSTGGGWCI